MPTKKESDLQGELYFDNSDATLREKVIRAAKKYEDKRGEPAQMVLVSSDQYTEDEAKAITEIVTRTADNVLKHNLFVVDTPF